MVIDPLPQATNESSLFTRAWNRQQDLTGSSVQARLGAPCWQTLFFSFLALTAPKIFCPSAIAKVEFWPPPPLKQRPLLRGSPGPIVTPLHKPHQAVQRAYIKFFVITKTGRKGNTTKESLTTRGQNLLPLS